MASNWYQPPSEYSLASLITMIFLFIHLLFLHTPPVLADHNPSVLSHFSRLHKHHSSSSSSSSSMNNEKQEFYTSLELCMNHALLARSLAFNLSITALSHIDRTTHNRTGPLVTGSLNDCLELLDDTLEMLAKVVVVKGKHYNHDDDDDVHTWLSAALTNQETCKMSLHEHPNMLIDEHEASTIASVTRNLSYLLKNSLDLFVSTKQKKPSSARLVGHRRLLSEEDFPRWVSLSQRKLLEASVEELRAHAVVATDGSGTHKSIGEAVAAAALSVAGVSGRSVIYVKAGTYKENINIPTKRKNVMLVGDGKGKTVIVAGRSNKGSWTTYDSATVGAMGDGFIARDITFVNSAGPDSSQAVALRVGSDRSVVFRCSVVGFQDTLYTHSKRQFYRDTDISGTVDFIFGNSAAVFQNCNIFARKPLPGQSNFVTAQGREDPNQNTGISIHNCKIAAAPDLAGSKSATYLGRPWKKYSRTAVMQSFLDGSIHKSGWAAWADGSVPNTLFYGEFANTGPGSSTAGRVKWAGYHPALAVTEAEQFTVERFIDGNMWLPSTGVTYVAGLLK